MFEAVVRSLLQDHKLVTKFMAETKINLWLARRLEVEHEKVAREFGMDPVETGGMTLRQNTQNSNTTVSH